MVIKKYNEVPYEDKSGYEGIKKQFLIGPRDGSNEIIMRCFSVEPGFSTPRHNHDFPHLVKVEKGNGIVIDKDGNKHKLSPGSLIYVEDNEVHNFENTGNESFEIICIVPQRGEK